MMKNFILGAIAFLSAFLLFQIELIVAKVLLPNFGGSYTVWGACIVFFQAFLLLGYVFSHVVIQKQGIARYRPYHLLLSLTPLLFFPGQSLVIESSSGIKHMGMNIFVQLMLSIGPVFFVLSTMSIVWQSWFESSKVIGHENPYKLYGISNFGSFAGLLSYPLFFELLFTLETQINIWRFAYLVLLGLQLFAYFLIRPLSSEKTRSSLFWINDKKASWRWFFLGAAPTILFLAVTNITTSEIIQMPLLWIIPLSIYLASFVLNFKKTIWCPNWIKNQVHFIIAISVVLYFLTFKSSLPFIIEFFFYCSCLFFLCMYCQNTLIQSKPDDPKNLTFFYVCIAAGSFVGGFIVNWLFPLLPTSHCEFLFGLGILSISLIKKPIRSESIHENIRLIIYTVILLLAVPLTFLRFNGVVLLALTLILCFIFARFKKNGIALFLCLMLIFFSSGWIEPFWANTSYVFRHRNHYGIYTIIENAQTRFFKHGVTFHGAQYLDPLKKHTPLGYYAKETPVGQVMTSNQFLFKKIGIIGLGTGSLAAYTSFQQQIDIFEIDPQMKAFMQQYFTYIPNSQGEVTIIDGDARISLNSIENNKYDILIVDAFSGDAVPAHLLTTEAMHLYKRVLKEDGILLFHTSNRFIKLSSVVAANASATEAFVAQAQNPKISDEIFASAWIGATWNRDSYLKFQNIAGWYPYIKDTLKKIEPWTDQYSNIIIQINYQNLWRKTIKFIQ